MLLAATAGIAIAIVFYDLLTCQKYRIDKLGEINPSN